MFFKNKDLEVYVFFKILKGYKLVLLKDIKLLNINGFNYFLIKYNRFRFFLKVFNFLFFYICYNFWMNVFFEFLN